MFHEYRDKDNKLKVKYDGRIRRMEISKDPNGVPCKLIPDEINRVVKEVDGVQECESIIVDDKKYLTRAVTFITLENEENIRDIKSTIIKHCQESLPIYMVPVDIIVVKNIPKLTSGKNNIVLLEDNYKNNKVKKRVR